MKLSIVATLYQSAPYIEEFCSRAAAVAQQICGTDYEIILVNDGSPDNSRDLAIGLTQRDSHIVLVDLSRNFGHHKAMMTGLRYARGDYVFLLDSDLEEEPEWLFPFYEQLRKEDVDVVHGVQANRKGGFFERITGWCFYRIFRALSGINQPDNIVTARLMSRRYVQSLIAHQERELNIGGLFVITGFRQSLRAVHKGSSSPTTYSLSKKFSHLVNAITSFSGLPLIATFYAGLIISLTAAFFIAYLVFRYIFISTPPDGYTSIITSIWFFSGLIILFVGVQGIYISKIFVEVKARPYTIVRQVYFKSLSEYGEAEKKNERKNH